MNDEEIIARWYILDIPREHHVATVKDISNGKLAHYTGGMVDNGDLYYEKVLGFEGDISIEYLRSIVDKLNGDLK